MAEAEHPSGGISGSRRPALRGDLRVVYDNPGDGGDAIHLVDPKSGRQVTLDRREHALVQAADGTADLAALQARQAAGLEEGAALTEAEVARFFRRLHALGFLQPEAGRPSDRPAGGTAGRGPGFMARRRRESAAEEPAGDGSGDGAEERTARAKSLMERRRRERAQEQAQDLASAAAPKTGSRTGPGSAPGAGTGPAFAAGGFRNRLAGRRPQVTGRAGPAAAGHETGPPVRGTGSGRALLDRRRQELEGKSAVEPVEDTQPARGPESARSARDPEALRARLMRLRQEREARAGSAPGDASEDISGRDEARDTGSDEAGTARRTAPRDTAPDAAAAPAPQPAAPAETAQPSEAPPAPETDPASGPDAAPAAEPASAAPETADETVERGPDAPAKDFAEHPDPAAPQEATETAEATTAPQQEGPGAEGRPEGAGAAVGETVEDPAEETPEETPAEGTGADTGVAKAPPATGEDSSGQGAAEAVRAAMASAEAAALRSVPAGPEEDAPAAPARPEPASGPAAEPEPEARPAGSRPRSADTAQPATRPAPAKKPARASDLMTRRLRERADRGHAPDPGKPARPVDPAPGSFAPAARQDPASRIPPQTARGGAQQDLDFDFLRDDFDAPGGGMGMRGGMMGGGMGMRGGMMGGGMGMRGGMGGGMGGGPGGGMGGMMGGGMMGGMRGGMGGAQQQSRPKKKMPGQLPLFDPQGLLRFLYVAFYPLKFILWAIVPLVVLAVMTSIQNFPALVEDFSFILSDFSYVAQFFMAMFGASLIARLAQGVAIVAHGGRVPVLALALVFGIIPRFVIDRNDIPNLDRRGQLWAYGATLMARLSLFCVGMVIWAISRDGGGILPYAALIVAQFSLSLFLITAWPLLPSDGQRWFSVMLNEPKLMGKSLMALKYTFKGGDLPPMLSPNQVLPLVLFGLGTLLTVVLFFGIVFVAGLTFLVGTYDGLGLVMFIVAAAAVSFWFFSLFSQGRQSRKGGAGGFDPSAFKELVRGRAQGYMAEPEDEEERAQTKLPSRAKVIWALILCGLVAVSFLPYSYETGGEVEILPTARGQATARTDGEIVEVMVREGDAVTQGQVLAQLSSWNQEADIRSTRTQLAAARAALTKLENGAPPEEIEVARKQLESAQASVAFKQAEVVRNRELADRGVVSQATLEKAESDLEIDLADLEVARANYNEVVAPASEEDLEIARADVEKLEEQLAFQQDELERARIVAPLDGRVITGDLNLRLGSFLRTGDVLLEIEQTDTVTATILVTESDIGLIETGDTVRLKVSGQSADEIPGQVQAIAPSATEEESFGRAIRVTAEFDNADGVLRSGMTGYAKIEGEEMRVWEAYLRSIRHFFQIEVWSWIP